MAGTPSYYTPSAIEIPRAAQYHTKARPQLVHAALPDRIRSSAVSMSNVAEAVPPPLPPPRFVDAVVNSRDPAWHFENQDNRNDVHLNSIRIKPGSSLLGGHRTGSNRIYSGHDKKTDLGMDTMVSSSTGNGYKSDGSDSPSKDMRIPDLRELLEYNSQLQSEKQMGEKTLERSSQAYDKQLLSRIGGPKTPQLRSGESGGEDSPTSAQMNSQKTKGLRPLAMPERRYSDLGSRSPRSAWAAGGGDGAPPSATLSPRFSGLRSPISEYGMETTRSQPSRTATMKSDDSLSRPGHLMHRDSFEQSAFSPQEHISRSPGGQPHAGTSPAPFDDYLQNSKTGLKRRAPSPAAEAVFDPRLPGNARTDSNSWQRRHQQLAGRNSHQPTQSFQTPSSLSSTGSSVAQNASFPSSYGLSNASTTTRYSSDRSSPGSYPPADITSNNSPHNALSMQPPSRIDSSNGTAIPQRSTAPTLPRAPGLWICDCCPKKPKKFDSEDELRIHELEKQYICQYCHNRFKNKNEAERHQNSLHLRRHSWSCASLTSFEAAFHSTPSNSVMASIQGPNYNPNNAAVSSILHNPGSGYPGSLHSTPTDTCGYCGMEFVNPPNWEDRVEHLNHVHKFGECNQSKKFFRADHFRQHLKHSHAGTSGKWTNMLETACMKDEPPPQPLNHGQLPPGMTGITMVGQQQLLAAAAAAAAAGVGQGSMSGYGSPALGSTGMGSPLSSSIGIGSQMGLGLIGMQPPAGQQAMLNATGPMGGGGPPAPIAGMITTSLQGHDIVTHAQHSSDPSMGLDH